MKQIVSTLALVALASIAMSCGCTQGSCTKPSSSTVTSNGGTGTDCGGGAQTTPPTTTADAGGEAQAHPGG